MRAKCFSEDDKRLMVERVRSNQTGLQNKKFRPEQVKEALLDIQTWCYCFIQICTTLPTSGLGGKYHEGNERLEDRWLTCYCAFQPLQTSSSSTFAKFIELVVEQKY